MTDLRFEKFKLRGHRVGASSWFPAIRELIKTEISTKLDEDDGLFIGYGIFQDSLPYTLQDNYDTPEEELEFQAAVLENQYLKAVFLPELGGRLWSLYDKENKRDLLLSNTRLVPCNLAICNAYFEGGVEFNCGRRGHDVQTMSPRFCAVVRTEKFPVLRIYEYQRDRGTPFQYDCFLPEDSHFLYIRGRIYNPNITVEPMYWWSNMALPEVPGSRVIVPAMNTFANWYSGGSHKLAKLSLPNGEGFDGTYPVNFNYVRDHFYNIPENSRRYVCLFYEDGYGFCHVSTKRLRGRKLFVWGQCQGGRHWNKKLLGPGLDSHIELQGGIGRSQQECLPMPPKTAWEWLEGYGSLRMDPVKVHGEWKTAIESTAATLDQIIPVEDLEVMLRETRESIALKPGEVVIKGSGWAALEELRTGEKLAHQLDFGTVGPEQAPWVELLKEHTITTSFPASYQVRDEWFEQLRSAKPTWQTHYHLALNYYRRKEWERAEQELIAAGTADNNRHLLHAWANLRNKQRRNEEAADFIFRAGMLDTSDVSFIKEVLKMLTDYGEYEKMSALLSALPREVEALPLIQMMKAAALAHMGKPDEAEAILTQNGGLNIPDIREGENSTSQLYIFIKTEQTRLKGKTLDPKSVQIPFLLDLRMSE